MSENKFIFEDERLSKKGPVVLVGITIDDKIIEIIGEHHYEPENAFYEDLISHKNELLHKKKVWTEHTTLHCSLKRGTASLFESATGSEYIWHKLALEPRPSECIDIRMEKGFPSGQEEYVMKQIIAQITQEDGIIPQEVIYKLFEMSERVLTALISLKNDFTILPETKKMFNEYIKALQTQHKLINLMVKTNLNVPENSTFNILALNYCKNLQKIASLSVDVYVIRKILESPSGSHVIIFMGAAHAIRIGSLFKDSIYIWTNKETKEKDMQDAGISPYGNLEDEEHNIGVITKMLSSSSSASRRK